MCSLGVIVNTETRRPCRIILFCISQKVGSHPLPLYFDESLVAPLMNKVGLKQPG